jgi:hypothetical protein
MLYPRGPGLGSQLVRKEKHKAAWASLHSTASYPFARPEMGKIAVEAIMHCGEKVLKVYEA